MKSALDTRVWLLWMIAAMLFTVLSFSPIYLVALMITLILLSIRHGVSAPDIIKVGIVFSLPMLLVNILFVHTGEHVVIDIPRTVSIGGHTMRIYLISGAITMESILNGLVFVLLMIDMFLIFSIFNKRTDPDALVRVIPNYLSRSAILLGISLKFVPTLMKDMKSIGDVQKSRGLNLDDGSIFKRTRGYMGLVMPTIVNSLERSYNLAESIESRGFSSKRSRYVKDVMSTGDRTRSVWLVLMIGSFMYFKFNGYLDGWDVLTLLQGDGPSVSPIVLLSIIGLSIPVIGNEKDNQV